MHAFLVTGADHQSRFRWAKTKIRKSFKLKKLQLTKLPDVFLIPKAASIPISQVRRLKQFVYQKPFSAPIKAVLILEAQNLTLPAQQALLKTLEEPPQDTIIILTVPNTSLVLPTIVSRCQTIHLKTHQSHKLAKAPTASQGAIKKLLSQLPKLSASQRLALAANYAGSRDQAIEFCENLLTTLRQNLRSNPPKPAKASRSLNQTSLTLSRLQSNVNPKLALENLLLNL